MNELQIYNSKEFGDVRTIELQGKPLFCGSDVAKALGYGSNPNDAIRRHCREDGCVIHAVIDSLGRSQPTRFIDEGNMYRLISQSRLPSAVRFEAWVFDEVLPSLRKHGAYMTTDKLEEVMNDPDAWIKMLTALKDERRQRKALLQKVEADHPKVLFADAVTASDDSILVGELAKLLKARGMDIGQNRLYARLRDEGFLIKKGRDDYNRPTQYAMNLGLFELNEYTITSPQGNPIIRFTTKVTGKGQQYFINRFIGKAV